EAAAPTTAWSPVPAQLQDTGGGTVLNADLGNAIEVPFQQDGKVFSSSGRFLVDSGIELGVVDPSSGGFRPFAQGTVSFADLYRPLQSVEKNVDLVAGSGMVSVPLTPEEATLAGSALLAVRHGGEIVLVEPAGGVLMDLSVRSLRLEQGGSATFQLLARRFGQPIVGERPVTWTVDAPPGGQAGDLTVGWLSPTDANGIATLEVSATNRPLTLPPNRQPLGSLVYFVDFFDAQGQQIGDGPYFIGGAFNLSVLMFQAYTAPANPTWEDDVGPILGAYARLYPGMQDKLDIADEATVLGFAGAVAGRMALPIEDPAYMPVTRDLSPAKVKMIVDWLNAQSGGRS
ncbi:MAG TPA: Ig-like domain-containing protein, partial [Thermoanaerobaculia bacterium]|nr:Ig-like domain-containing protein [Thermoanaerobaculia bacterium]